VYWGSALDRVPAVAMMACMWHATGLQVPAPVACSGLKMTSTFKQLVIW